MQVTKQKHGKRYTEKQLADGKIVGMSRNHLPGQENVRFYVETAPREGIEVCLTDAEFDAICVFFSKVNHE